MADFVLLAASEEEAPRVRTHCALVFEHTEMLLTPGGGEKRTKMSPSSVWGWGWELSHR